MATRRTKIFWALYFGGLLLIWIIIALSGYSYYRQEYFSKNNPIWTVTSKNSQYNAAQLQNSSSLLALGIGYTSFSEEKGLKLEIGYTPRNNLTNGYDEPKVPVCISYSDKDIEYKKGEEMNSESVSVLLAGDINTYPFDYYMGTFTLMARTKVGDGENATCSDPLPVLPLVIGSAQGFAVYATATPGNNDDGSLDYSTINVDFYVRRAKLHIVFSCFIFMVMWALSLMLTFICCWTWKGGKRVELGIVAMTAALFYALPRVRESQPGVPKVGIIQDLVGYCWNIFMISVCLISLLVNFILRKERKQAIQAQRRTVDSMEKLVFP